MLQPQFQTWKNFALTLFLFITLSVQVWAEVQEAGSGIVYGPGHAYKLSAPEEWLFDNESGISQGIQAVIYPVGETWAQSKVVLYTGATQKEEGDFQQIMADDEANYRAQNPNLVVSQEETLLTSDGRQAVVKKFSGDSLGNSELVAYIDTPEVVCLVVLSARDLSNFELGQSAFSTVVSSFKFLATDAESYIQSGKWRDELDPSQQTKSTPTPQP